jgi:hypothetical protein
MPHHRHRHKSLPYCGGFAGTCLLREIRLRILFGYVPKSQGEKVSRLARRLQKDSSLQYNS